MYEDVTVKGIFLINLIDVVKSQKGSAGLIELEKVFGDKLKFSSFKDYPMTTEVKLVTAAGKVLYGADNDTAQWEFGKETFNVYANSFIGKTMFALHGNEFWKVALGLEKTLSTVTKNLVVEVERPSHDSLRIRVANNPHHVGHFGGIFYGCADFYGKSMHIKPNKLGEGDYEYQIKIDNP